VTGPQLAKAVLEGEDPKEFLRRMSRVNDSDFQRFLASYLETMLWSSHLPPYDVCPACGREDQVLDRWDEEGEPVCRECSKREPNHEPAADENYDVDDISPEFRQECANDCLAFVRENAVDIANNGEPIRDNDPFTAAGHDFWLTRNHHGAGFWDGDWPEDVGERLTEASHPYGEVNLWVDQAGKVHGE